MPKLSQAEHRAEPPEAVDHLVGHDQHVVFAADLLDTLPIGARGHDHAAGSHERLADEGRDRLRSFVKNHCLQFGREPLGEGLLALTGQRVAVMVRGRRMPDKGKRQVEALLVDLEPGQAAGGQRDAVIAALAGDELLLLGTAERIVVVPDELDDGVVGFTA